MIFGPFQPFYDSLILPQRFALLRKDHAKLSQVYTQPCSGSAQAYGAPKKAAGGGLLQSPTELLPGATPPALWKGILPHQLQGPLHELMKRA